MKPEFEIEVLRRSTPAGGLDSNLRLTPPEWRLFTAADGRASLADLARRFELSGEAMSLLAEKLKAAGLLAPAEYTTAEYHELFGTATESGATANAPVSPAAETGPRKFTASLKRRVPGAAPVGAPTGAGLSEANSPERDQRVSGTLARRESFHLRPLIDFIVSTAGGGTKGQLAVYRVFCKVPNELLLKSRITSLNLVGDDFEIQDSNLKTRLLEATRSVLGVEYV